MMCDRDLVGQVKVLRDLLQQQNGFAVSIVAAYEKDCAGIGYMCLPQRAQAMKDSGIIDDVKAFLGGA